MSRQQRVLCGTPKEHCTGSKLVTDQALPDKAHRNHDEAFRCYAKYLVNVLGFIKIGAREFKDPKSGFIRVLTKKVRFGGDLVYGKEQNRFMPERRKAGNRGVVTG